jgi:hypothetical protein
MAIVSKHFVSASLAVALTLAGPLSAYSADFEYPELNVTPRASDRVEMEAKKESSERWTTHWPVQLSAISTLFAAAMVSGNHNRDSDPNGRAPLAGYIVGGSWLVGSLILSNSYAPYQSAQSEMAELPRKTLRDQLTRERMAEEAIDRAASLGRKLAWMSTITNFAAAAYMNGKSEKSTIGEVASLGAMALSATPLLFNYRWGRVAYEQREYKKRIFAPVASAGVVPDQRGSLMPTMSLSMAF